MPPRVWLALPLLASLFGAACSSTTENPGSGGSSSGGAAGGGGAKSFEDCVLECDALGSGNAFKAALNTCACVTATPCKAVCETFCTGTAPTFDCFKCDDPAKNGCLINTCSGDCDGYRTCLATCASKL